MTTLSFNINNLKNFIEQNKLRNNITISYRLYLKEIVFNKIINNLKSGYKLLEKKYILFNKDNIYAKFEINNKEIDLINNYVSDLLKYNNVSNIINHEIFINRFLIKDLIFEISIIEKINSIENFDNAKVKYVCEQIIEYKNFSIIILNNKKFFIEINVDYNNLNEDVIDLLIEVCSIIYPDNIIIENDYLLNKLESTPFIKPKQPHTLSIINLLDNIDNQYVASLKFDGVRIKIMNNELDDKSLIVYFNSNNNCFKILDIKKMNFTFVLDAELVDDRYYILDLIYHSNINIYNLSLFERIELLNKIVKDINYNKFHIVIPVIFDKSKEDFFNKVVNLYLTSSEKNDGIIFTPITSFQIRNQKNLIEYKWKPIENSSVDFLIKFDKNNFIKTLTKKFLKVELYVFDIETQSLKLFSNSNVEFIDDDAYTLENEILVNDSIVEFIPDFIENDIDEEGSTNESNLFSENSFNWIPLRIRYDKENPNEIKTANDTIDYINYPIKFEYFQQLSENYENAYLNIQNTILDKKIKSVAKIPDKRIFDYVETLVLLSWARYLVLFNKINPNIIEINCRKGLNIFKIYSYAVLFNMDPTYNGYNTNNLELLSNIDGFNSRFKTIKETRPNFFKFNSHFIKSYDDLLKIDFKFNTLFDFEFYRYQNSINNIKLMKSIYNKILKNNSYLFLVIGDIKDNKEQNSFIINNKIYDYYVNFNSDKVLEILNYKVLDNITFDEALKNLLIYKDTIKYLLNKKTNTFLYQAISDYQNVNQEIYKNIRFVVLQT